MKTAVRERRPRKGERGQVLIIFAAFLTVIFLFGAISVDYGLWLSERRGIARAADFAALAASQDLPPKVAPPSGTITTVAGCAGNAACLNAFKWADRNGYGIADGATVEVTFFCGNSLPNPPPPGICFNENANTPPFFLSLCPNAGGEIGCDAINVSVHKPAVALFSQFFGGVSFDIGYSSWGRVSFKLVPQDTVLALDVTGSMAGQPLVDAKAAANKFTDILLNNGNSLSQVGFSPYTHCFNPPRTGAGAPACVPVAHLAGSNALNPATCPNPPAAQWDICLGRNAARVHAKINAVTAGGNTNVCLGLYEADSASLSATDGMFHTGLGASTAANAQRFVVILTDGDNNYSSTGYSAAQNTPPTACRPPTPTTNGNGNGCVSGGTSGANEMDLDSKTKALATAIKNSAVHTEIYVVAYNVCGANNASQYPTAAYCGAIGNTNGDMIADRRLLKCIASSTPGTNDHYFESPTSAQLDGIFQQVAYEIADHGLVAVNGS